MIETERLTIRHWRESDADDLFRYASDVRVSEMALWPAHSSVEMSRDVIRRVFIPNKNSFAMVLKLTGEAIGCIGLVPAGEEHYTPCENEREVGYWIGYPHWGKGLTSEALKSFVHYCKHDLGLQSLLLTTDSRNVGSRMVARKCGFVQFDRYDFEGTDSVAYRLKLNVTPDIADYVEREIIPRYAAFDKAHREDHVLTVIEQSMKIADKMPHIDPDMAYVVAAFHDVGLVNGRENHHRDSRRILESDEFVKTHFSATQILVMGEAVEDHRASNGETPRSDYGLIVAEADRQIDPETIIRRTIQYGLARFPELDFEGQYKRTVQHLTEKYGPNGYINIRIPWSGNARRLEELRALMKNENAIADIIRRIFKEETSAGG